MKTNFNPWPYALIATFVIFIGGTVGLVVMASTQRVDLVNDNYYEQEIRYQSRIDSLNRANQLGATASVNYDAALKCIVVTLPAEQARHGISGQVDLYRPSLAGLDRQFKLEMKTNNVQPLDAGDLQPGLWKIRVRWTATNQEFFIDKKIIVGTATNK